MYAGASLAMIQAAVFLLVWVTAPLRAEGELSGPGLLGFMLFVVVVGYVGGWVPYRALRSWRARSPRVVGRLAISGLLLMPLGLLVLEFGAGLFSLAGLLLALGALAARRRVEEFERRDGDGSAV